LKDQFNFVPLFDVGFNFPLIFITRCFWFLSFFYIFDFPSPFFPFPSSGLILSNVSSGCHGGGGDDPAPETSDTVPQTGKCPRGPPCHARKTGWGCQSDDCLFAANLPGALDSNPTERPKRCLGGFSRTNWQTLLGTWTRAS